MKMRTSLLKLLEIAHRHGASGSSFSDFCEILKKKIENESGSTGHSIQNTIVGDKSEASGNI